MIIYNNFIIFSASKNNIFRIFEVILSQYSHILISTLDSKQNNKKHYCIIKSLFKLQNRFIRYIFSFDFLNNIFSIIFINCISF